MCLLILVISGVTRANILPGSDLTAGVVGGAARAVTVSHGVDGYLMQDIVHWGCLAGRANFPDEGHCIT